MMSPTLWIAYIREQRHGPYVLLKTVALFFTLLSLMLSCTPGLPGDYFPRIILTNDCAFDIVIRDSLDDTSDIQRLVLTPGESGEFRTATTNPDNIRLRVMANDSTNGADFTPESMNTKIDGQLCNAAELTSDRPAASATTVARHAKHSTHNFIRE
jgi:hypothetical protein